MNFCEKGALGTENIIVCECKILCTKKKKYGEVNNPLYYRPDKVEVLYVSNYIFLEHNR